MNHPQKIAVTIVTGFLGSGKTTFINSLLKKYPEIQFALVENEFGDVAIDTKLIKGVDASRLFELKQGCICCTVSDEYEFVLRELAERFPRMQHLLIETTGIADPAPVIRPFFRDEHLQSVYRFNGTICLVDAINYDHQPEKEIAIKQLAHADVVLVNKSENLAPEDFDDFIEKIREINPYSEVYFSRFGHGDDFQFEQTSFSRMKFTPTSRKHRLLQTKTITFDRPLKKEEFLRQFSWFFDLHKHEIYRVKGILCFENELYYFLLQGVGGSFEISETDHIVDNPRSDLMFIGNLSVIDFGFNHER